MKSLVQLAYAFAAIIFIVILAAGCSPVLTAQSAAPPGRSARLDEVTNFWGIQSYRVELNEGVALAFTCYRGGPCANVVVTSDNRDVADVKPASLGVLQPSRIANAATSSAVVIIGKRAGKAQLHLHSKEGDREIAVTVVPPPEHGATAAVALIRPAGNSGSRRSPRTGRRSALRRAV